MVVISRKIAETVVIDACEVTIVEIRPDKVRLGITAPQGSVVHRKEVMETRDLSPRTTSTALNESEALFQQLAAAHREVIRYRKAMALLLQGEWQQLSAGNLPELGKLKSRFEYVLGELERDAL